MAALDEKNKQTNAWSKSARKWSLLGALNSLDCSDKLKLLCMGRIRVFTRPLTLTEFNLTATQDQVLEVLRKCKR